MSDTVTEIETRGWTVWSASGVCLCTDAMRLTEAQARTKVDNDLRSGFRSEARPPVPQLDQMRDDLLAAGWREKTPTLWKDPNGMLFVGPSGAWRVMKERESSG